MDLELQMEEISCYEMAGAFTETGEEVMETAIPEYCPDMARIVEASGELCIREKVPGSDVFTATGAVKVTILYTSEEVSGLRSLTVSVPCSCKWESEPLIQCDQVTMSGRVLLVDAKAVTTRKLYLKVMTEWTACGYQMVSRSICKDVQPEPTLRTKYREWKLDVLKAVEEKRLSFSQDTMLPDGMQPEDLLLCKLTPRIHSLQRVGNKLSLRGEMLLRILYRDAQQSLKCFETSLPIAEILEGGNLPEDGTLHASCQLSDYDGRLLRTENSGGFGISAGITVTICCFGQYQCTCLMDLYSTRYAVAAERRNIPFPEMQSAAVIQKDVTLPLEFGTKEPFLFLSGVDCSAVVGLQDETRYMLRTTLHMKMIYLDEEGTATAAERSQEVETEAFEDYSGATAQCSDISFLCAGGTGELHCRVAFCQRRVQEKEISVLQSVNISEIKQDAQPSIVLRRIMADEELWDIAKQYRTDEKTILSANPGGIDTDRMLLIPKIR